MKWTKKICIYKIYSQENTGEDLLFSAVADMWAYIFFKRDSVTDVIFENCEVLQKVIFTEHCCATASDFLHYFQCITGF